MPSRKSPEVVVVEASAGSGKTYALAKRYLELLLDPRLSQKQIPLRSILAITFTNKATVEMKERILELLKKIAFDRFSSPQEKSDILSDREIPFADLQKQAVRAMDEIIAHYNFFSVQTIDSFINAMLLGCALNIDRSAAFKIKRDYRAYLEYSLDKTIADAASDKKLTKLLEDFLEHYLFVENRNGWFPKKDILILMQSLFAQVNKYGGDFAPYQGKSKAVIALKRKVFADIQWLQQNLPEGINAQFTRTLETFLAKNTDIFDIQSLPEKFKNPDPPMNKDKNAPQSLCKKWKKINKDLIELIELDATAAYNPYINLFNLMLANLSGLSRKDDVLFLEELNRKARGLFGPEGVSVAEVYYRMAARFKHYLVDEFQDTSRLQWRNLEVMVEDALSVGGSLFYVGDKKQAIYRFRGGEAGLFDQVKHAFKHFNPDQRLLSKNWRSQRTIVDFNNQVFSADNLRSMLEKSRIVEELAPDAEKIDWILDVFSQHVQECRPDRPAGYVKVERLGDFDQRERDRLIRDKLIGLLGELKNRFSFSAVAVLTRNNSEVELVSSMLIQAGIAVESEKTLDIRQNSRIKSLISFLTFLHSPIDDLNFAGFILSDIFLTASGLIFEEVRDFIFALRKNRESSRNLSLYRSFRNKYPAVWDACLDEFFKSVGFISPYELLISIYRRYRVMENFPQSQGFFMKLLEVVKKQEEDCPALGDFLQYFDGAPTEEDFYVNTALADAVKVLTIHKSKGLEFGAVIIPFFRMDIDPSTGGKGTSSFIDDDHPPYLGLVRITAKHCGYSEKLNQIYSQAYAKACLDELNNLYVALTRAKDELYIFIPAKSGNSKNKAALLIPETITELGQVQPQVKRPVESEALKVSPSNYADWIAFLKEEFGDSARIKNRENILEGNIIHAMLSKVGALTEKNKDGVVSAAVEGLEIYEKKLKQIVGRGDLKHLFFVGETAKVFCEKEVVNSFGDLKRIDRLVVTEDEAWVVDYKSTRPDDPAGYQKQVKEYMDIVSQIYPGRRVKGCLVFLDTGEADQV